jgi:hypothetical protein
MADFKTFLMDKKAIGIRAFMLSLIVLMVCVFLTIGIVINFLSVTNPSSDMLKNYTSINKSFNALDSSLSKVQDTANIAFVQTQNSSLSPTEYVFLIFRGAFEVPMTILSFTFSSITTLEGIVFDLGGRTTLGTVFLLLLNLIFAGLTFTLVFYIIRFIRSGAE